MGSGGGYQHRRAAGVSSIGETGEAATLSIVSELESEVRSYCRNWPAVFTTARGAVMEDEAGAVVHRLLRRGGGRSTTATTTRACSRR